nr:hypothetical protein [Tanacetum cinerariifolium]
SAKGKQPLRATTPVEPTDLQRTEAKQLKIILKRSKQKTHISQQSGSGTELAKDDEEDKETGKGGDEVRESEGESEEEEGSFDPIPRTPEDSEKESDDEEEQESRLSEE